MNDTLKYTLRKLAFLVVLAALIASPFAVQAYKSATTTDPYILMAREIEGFEKGGVDVLGIEDHQSIPGRIVLVSYIEDYSNWSVRQDQHNFTGAVLRAIARYDFESVLILIGWDFPPPDFRVQGLWSCEELRRTSCVWEIVPSVVVQEKYILWPGIGNP